MARRLPQRLAWLASAFACTFAFTLLHSSARAYGDGDGEGAASEFHFARLAFGAYGERFGTDRGEPWLRDWPEADYHFIRGLRRLTRIDSAPGASRQVMLTSDELFDYPVVYAVDRKSVV